jgi:hypothetical protein
MLVVAFVCLSEVQEVAEQEITLTNSSNSKISKPMLQLRSGILDLIGLYYIDYQKLTPSTIQNCKALFLLSVPSPTVLNYPREKNLV